MVSFFNMNVSNYPYVYVGVFLRIVIPCNAQLQVMLPMAAMASVGCLLGSVFFAGVKCFFIIDVEA